MMPRPLILAGTVSVPRNFAIDSRRPRTSLRSTGAVTIATIIGRPDRPSSIVAPSRNH